MLIINYDKEYIEYDRSYKNYIGKNSNTPVHFGEYRRMPKSNVGYLKEALFKSLCVGEGLKPENFKNTLKTIGSIYYNKPQLERDIKDDLKGISELDEQESRFFVVEKEKAKQQIEIGFNFLKASPKPNIPKIKKKDIFNDSVLMEDIEITLNPTVDVYPSTDILFQQLANSDSIREDKTKRYLNILRLDYSGIDPREFMNFIEIPSFAILAYQILDEITDPLINTRDPFLPRIKAYDIKNAVTHFNANEDNSEKYNHLQKARAIHYKYESVKDNLPFEYDSIRNFLKK
jgi:hypothetical protein